MIWFQLNGAKKLVLLLAIAGAVVGLGLLAADLGQSVAVPLGGSDLKSSLDQIIAAPAEYDLIPEYAHHLNQVVLSLSDNELSLHYHDALISSFPSYTKVILMVPAIREAAIRAELQAKPYRDRLTVCTFVSEVESGGICYLLFSDKERLVQIDLSKSLETVHYGTLWAQDLFEVGFNRIGNPVLLIPELHKFYFSTHRGGDGRDATVEVKSDNGYLTDLAALGVETTRLPIAFMGGNILVDQIENRTLVFVGSDVVRGTRLIWQALDELTVDETYLKQVLRGAFAADEIVVIGDPDRQQPDRMFHLDQVMTIVRSGVACVQKIVPGQNSALAQHRDVVAAELFLRGVREALLAKGYQIVDLETTPENVLAYRHYVNLIPYRDRNTGEAMLLMPVFEKRAGSGSEAMCLRNRNRLEKLGFRIVPVPTEVNTIYGGIHCLANVIS